MKFFAREKPRLEPHEKLLAEAQERINELKQHPIFGEYVKVHKLALIDSRLSVYDNLLSLGLIKA